MSTLASYRKGNLWYEAGRHLDSSPFLFPIPIEDVGDATFSNVDKGLLFMRWIRPALDLWNEECQKPSKSQTSLRLR